MRITYLPPVFLGFLGIIKVAALTEVETGESEIFTYSEEEKSALSQFRDLAADLTYREFMKSDGYLGRWLAEFDFDVELTLEKFTKFIEWRKQKNVDTIVFEDFSILGEELVFMLNAGFDKCGRPVVWSPIGTLDLRKSTIAGMDDFQRYMIRNFELVEIYLQMRAPVNPNVPQLVAIYDMAGFNLKTGGCFKCLKTIPEMVTNFDHNYPGLFYKAFLINTPKVFLTPLNIARNFMTEKSRQSILVYGYDKGEWMTALHEQIDANQLPIEYGGTQPTIHGKSTKEAALNFTRYLERKARESVNRDLRIHSDPGLISPAPASDVPIEDPKLKQRSRLNKYHHHHYRLPEAVQSQRTFSNAGVLTSGSIFNCALYIFVLMRMLMPHIK